MKKALVTGGAGFIGSHLVDRLISEGEWSVVVIDNFSSGRIDNLKHHIGSPLVKIVNGDLKSIEAIQSILIDVDVVFHFAANPEVRVSTINPQTHFNENIIATFNLLEAMRKKDVGELIFASSSSVYGEPKEIPVSEDAPIKPISVYGASKAACENLIHAYSHLYGIKAAVLRYANVVGGRMRHGVIYDFIVKLLKRSDELEILGDGTQIRSYIHVKDAIEAVMIIVKKGIKTFEVYNVGNNDWITVNEVAETITQAINLNNIRYVYKPVLHGVGWLGDVKRITLNIERLKQIGWKPSMNSRKAVETATIEIFKELLDSR